MRSRKTRSTRDRGIPRSMRILVSTKCSISQLTFFNFIIILITRLAWIASEIEQEKQAVSRHEVRSRQLAVLVSQKGAGCPTRWVSMLPCRRDWLSNARCTYTLHTYVHFFVFRRGSGLGPCLRACTEKMPEWPFLKTACLNALPSSCLSGLSCLRQGLACQNGKKKALKNNAVRLELPKLMGKGVIVSALFLRSCVEQDG